MGKEQVPETRDKRQKPGRKEALCENQNDGKEAEVRARIRELERMGFEKVFIPAGALREEILRKYPGIEVVGLRTLSQVLRNVFGDIKPVF